MNNEFNQSLEWIDRVEKIDEVPGQVQSFYRFIRDKQHWKHTKLFQTIARNDRDFDSVAEVFATQTFGFAKIARIMSDMMNELLDEFERYGGEEK